MKWDHSVLLVGVVLLAIGHGLGLFVAPAEAMMGDTGRILYVHVPTAWIAMLTFTACFVAAVGTLWTGRFGWDAMVEATAEVGCVLNALLLAQGSIWARPTWGTYWTWDPRLTTTAVMLVLFSSVLLLRKVIDQPERRLTLSAIAAIIAAVDVPIVYFAVKWWRTLHQDMSSPETVDAMMVLPLRVAAFGMLFTTIGLVGMRWRVAKAALDKQVDAPELPDMPEQLQVPSGTEQN